MFGSLGYWASSKGMVAVPNLSGLTEAQAATALSNATLSYSKIANTPTSDSNLVGKVATQSIAAGALTNYESTIQISIYEIICVPIWSEWYNIGDPYNYSACAPNNTLTYNVQQRRDSTNCGPQSETRIATITASCSYCATLPNTQQIVTERAPIDDLCDYVYYYRVTYDGCGTVISTEYLYRQIECVSPPTLATPQLSQSRNSSTTATISVTNYDANNIYSISTSGSATFSAGVFSITGLTSNDGFSATVTANRSGFASAQASISVSSWSGATQSGGSLTVLSTTTSSITLRASMWNVSPSSVTWYAQRGSTTIASGFIGPFTQQSSPQTEQFTASGLAEGTTYTFTLYVFGNLVSTISATTATTPPPPPVFTPPPAPCVPACLPGQICQNGICVAE